VAIGKLETFLSEWQQVNGTIDLGGAKLTFGPNDNQGMNEVFLTVIQKDGSFKSVKSLDGRSS
jgi:hypothetical protein